MATQAEKARIFAGLHKPGEPVILFNAWDAGSAQAVAKAGAKAIATGSWSVAAAHGYADGEKLPRELALANLERIVAAVSLPVTLDFEAGYGRAPEAVAEAFGKAVKAGAIGFNFEDRIIGEEGLYSAEEQAGRIRAARAACERQGVPVFINARTDVFLKARAEQHNAGLVEEALHRAVIYAEAGASGLFVPGLVDDKLIGKVCARSPMPVNVMYLPVLPGKPRLAELGVARISYGPQPYRAAMEFLEKSAREAFAATE